MIDGYEPAIFADYQTISNDDGGAQDSNYIYTFHENTYLLDLYMKQGSTVAGTSLQVHLTTSSGQLVRTVLIKTCAANEELNINPAVNDQKTANIDTPIGLPYMPYLIPKGFKLRIRCVSMESGKNFKLITLFKIFSIKPVGLVSGTNVSAAQTELGVVV